MVVRNTSHSRPLKPSSGTAVFLWIPPSTSSNLESAIFLKRTSQVALVVKNLPDKDGDIKYACLIPGSRRSLGGGNGNPLQYSCLGNPMGRGAWWAAVHGVAKSRHDWPTSLSRIGEGNGNSLQYSCLRNPMGRGAWWATVQGVAKRWTHLSD